MGSKKKVSRPKPKKSKREEYLRWLYRELTPKKERSFIFRGVRFFTRNLGAVNPMTENFEWYATGCWTHDQADGVFSDLEAAVADRFNLWEHLGFSYAPKFRDPGQLKAAKELRQELAVTLSKQQRIDKNNKVSKT